MRQIQQGDVTLQQVPQLPGKATRLWSGDKIVLAKGETTGHAHVITDPRHAALYEIKGELYLEVTAPVILTHEEHRAQQIPDGIYRVGQVREYDYFAEMERRVVD